MCRTSKMVIVHKTKRIFPPFELECMIIEEIVENEETNENEQFMQKSYAYVKNELKGEREEKIQENNNKCKGGGVGKISEGVFEIRIICEEEKTN